jgi:hypothetical protein
MDDDDYSETVYNVLMETQLTETSTIFQQPIPFLTNSTEPPPILSSSSIVFQLIQQPAFGDQPAFHMFRLF